MTQSFSSFLWLSASVELRKLSRSSASAHCAHLIWLSCLYMMCTWKLMACVDTGASGTTRFLRGSGNGFAFFAFLFEGVLSWYCFPEILEPGQVATKLDMDQVNKQRQDKTFHEQLRQVLGWKKHNYDDRETMICINQTQNLDQQENKIRQNERQGKVKYCQQGNWGWSLKRGSSILQARIS